MFDNTPTPTGLTVTDVNPRELSAVVDETVGTLTITLPLTGGVLSKSGKTLVIATTRGNIKPEGCEWSGRQVTIGVNAYVKR